MLGDRKRKGREVTRKVVALGRTPKVVRLAGSSITVDVVLEVVLAFAGETIVELVSVVLERVTFETDAVALVTGLVEVSGVASVTLEGMTVALDSAKASTLSCRLVNRRAALRVPWDIVEKRLSGFIAEAT